MPVFAKITIWLSSMLVLAHGNKNPGHLKQFGCCGKKLKVDEFEGWPSTKVFFTQYGKANRPLVMRGAANISPATNLWTDDYFLKLKIPKDAQTLDIENGKIENRNGEGALITFKKFLKSYNASDIYMVAGLPRYLAKDIVLPPIMQCSPMISAINKGVIWFSSGGTKSVIHTDGYDNVICIYRGKKQFILVDPHKFGEKVPIDVVEGSYSTINVEKVDFDKYPSLDEVEYYDVILEKGDCMFVPHAWIHQVNSYGNNLAINLWLNHKSVIDLSLNRCNNSFNPNLTLEIIFGNSLADKDSNLEEDIFEYLTTRLANNGTMSFKEFSEGILNEELAVTKSITLYEYIKIIFHKADENNDDVLNREEMTDMKLNHVIDIRENIKLIRQIHGQNSERHDEL